MRDVAEILVSWAVTTWAVFTLVRRDERKLSEAELARAWPDASRLSAIVVFGVFSVPVHFWRTRRSAWGLLVGLGWGLAVFALGQAAAEAIELIFPS